MARSPAQFLRFLGLAAVLLLLLGLTVPVATAARAATGDCPVPMPVAEIIDRLDAGEAVTGTGSTVVRGRDPEPFEVEVLGVQRHFFLPGRHIIIVQTDSAALRQAGGVWAGMSGSPVFAADGRLIGGLAWGFSAGPSRIAGLTPAQEMLDLLAYPPRAGAEAEPPGSASGQLSPALAARVRARDPGAGSRMTVLPLPVPVPNQRAVAFSQERFDARGLPLLAVPGGGTAGDASGGLATPQPGGNFAAAFSYGDNAYYASGTTAFACGGYAVAFAHFMDALGPTSLGGNDGHTIAVIDDPTLSPYKLMNLAAPFGTLDQDRFAGVRTRLGVPPPSAGIRTTLRDADHGRSTSGATDVLSADLFSIVAALHLWDAMDSTIDRWGRGTSTLRWTVTGTREGGAAWSLTRENMIASRWDVGYESITELEELLSRLYGNDAEVVSLVGVEIDGEVEERVRRSSVGAVSVSIDGAPPVPADSGLVVEPGAVLDLEVRLAGRDLPGASVFLSVRVPDDAAGFGSLRVFGGGSYWDRWDPYDGPVGSESEETFDDLLARLAGLPPNNSVSAELFLGDLDDGDDGPYGSAPLAGTGADAGERDRAIVDRVVDGERSFDLYVPWDGDNGGNGDNGDGPPGATALTRLAGRDRIDTAIAISQRTRPSPASTATVVLARADDYADALAGAPLAARLDAPLLLSRRETVPPGVLEEIARLDASRVVVLGGRAALSDAAVELLARHGLDVERVGGRDRFDTARLVARRVGGSEVYLALGAHADPARGWPDALAVSALAAARQRPVLLTLGGSVPAATRAALAEREVTALTIVGGTAAVSREVEDDLRAEGLVTSRLAGRTRYETSLAIAERAVAEGADGGHVWLVTGRDFPDALAAAPAVAAAGGVLLLVDGVRLEGSPAVGAWLAREGGVASVTVVGGRAAIGDDVYRSVQDRLPGTTE